MSKSELMIRAIISTVVTVMLGALAAITAIMVGSIVKIYFGIVGLCILSLLPLYAIYTTHRRNIRLREGIVNNLSERDKELDKIIPTIKGAKHG